MADHYTDDDRRASDALMEDLTGHTQDLDRGPWAEKARRQKKRFEFWLGLLGFAWIASVYALIAILFAWWLG